MIIELSIGIAYSLFSQSDWKLHEETLKRLEKENLADERVYFLDVSVPLLFVNFFKDGEPVEHIRFKSTKSKMKQALKEYPKW